MNDFAQQALARLAPVYERNLRYAVPAVQLILTALTAAVAAQLIWSLAPTPASAKWQATPVVSDAQPAAKQTHLDVVLGARLFGVYQPVAGNASSAPDTNLNLTLLGVFAGNSKETSRALIGTQDGNEQPYAIGQDVVAGVSLHAIFPDRVVLSRNGLLETLKLDKDKPSSGVIDTSGDSGTNNIAAQLGEMRQTILQDPNKAAEYIRVQAVTAGGGMKGYRVYPGPNQQLFSNVGLHPGDLVTSVNGVALDDAQKSLQMLTDLSKARNVSIVVERAGQPQTLNFTLN